MFDTRNDLPLNTRTTRQPDRHLWFLEAHLHGKR